MSPATMNRRSFLRLSSFSAGAWVLSELLPELLPSAAAQVSGHFQPSPLLRIDADGTVTIFVQKQEMGQGVRRSLPMLLAEELDVEIARVKVQALAYDAASAGQFNTWASASVKGAWKTVRTVGAAAREMLVLAAAQQWRVAPERVQTGAGVATNLDSGAVLTYGQLAAAASRLPVPAQPRLKQPHQFNIIGKVTPAPGLAVNIDGQHRYGIDVRLPGMLYAAAVRAPSFGATLLRYDDSATRALGAGIVAVIELKPMPGCDNPSALAVVATDTWLALQGRDLLKVEWQASSHAVADSAGLARALRAAMKGKPGQAFGKNGGQEAYQQPDPRAGKLYSAEYELPFLNQAPMEPPNCVARFENGKYEVWGGFQAPGFFASTLAAAFGVDKTQVFVHLQPMGGGFGRKEKVDNAAEAMQLAKRLGRPVQLVFSRSDDMRHSFYRPATVHRLSARSGKSGIEVWRHQAAVASFADGRIGAPQHLYGGLSNDLPYPVQDYGSAVYPVASPVPVGSWRSISYSQNVFAVESFIDELAVRTKADPVQFRLKLLRQASTGTADAAPTSHHRRLAHVLERCADAIGWARGPARGRYRGVACCVYTHVHAYVAHAFEISIGPGNAIRIHRVVCVVDCGVVVDPSGFRAQIEGSLVWGLSAAVSGEITFKDGAVVQQNFADYPVLRMHETPPLELIIVDSIEPPAGAGEPAVPSVAPALCNAIFAATRKRIRTLPLSKAGFTLAPLHG